LQPQLDGGAGKGAVGDASPSCSHRLDGGMGLEITEHLGLGIGAMEKRTCRDCEHRRKDWCRITGLAVEKDQVGCWWWTTNK